MAVLKTTSPPTDPVAPNARPGISVPSSSTSLIATEASIHEPLIEPRLPFGTAHSRELGYWKAQETQFAQDLKPADSCNTPEKGSSAPGAVGIRVPPGSGTDSVPLR